MFIELTTEREKRDFTVKNLKVDHYKTATPISIIEIEMEVEIGFQTKDENFLWNLRKEKKIYFFLNKSLQKQTHKLLIKELFEESTNSTAGFMTVKKITVTSAEDNKTAKLSFKDVVFI